MKKLFTLAFALICCIGMYADDYYLVGDGTKIGWTANSTMRQITRMYEKESGVFEYVGLLKHATEGFNIVNSNDGWNGFSCSTDNYAIGEAGTDNYRIREKYDKKWNPEDTDWRWYTITLDTNNGTLSWVRDAFTPLTPVDGVYYIGTAEELNKLATMVRSSAEDSYNVKLTADIDYTAYTNGINGAIGYVEYCAFNGEFDGQGHTITIDLSATWTRFSLFGTVVGTIHDLKVDGKITAISNNQIGGICGLLKNSGSKIYNCISAVEISDTQGGDGTIGGIAAVTYNDVTIQNCAFYGKISAPNRTGNGGIVAWASQGSETTIKNCLVVADITWSAGEDFGRNGPTVNNSYRTDLADATLANGEMTYKLNSYVSGGEDWYQTLGTDALPSPLYTSQKLYANGSFYCDGVTSKGGDVVLSNTNESIIDPHTFGEDGLCTVCKAAGQEATEVDGVFQLTNAGNLLWWAQYVNAGNPTSEAVLKADADLSAAKYVPAGTLDARFIGTFDGEGHTVTLALDNPELNYQGLFGVATDGATIKNVVVKGSVSGNSYVAGIVGGSNGGDDSKRLSIINCGNEATITAAGANGAGIIGVNMSGAAHFYISNCYNVGDVTSAKESGAITGWTGGDNSTIENVYNIGVIMNGSNVCTDFARGDGNLVNTYNLSASDAQVTSGELCFNLNGDQSTIAWYQKLGEDAHPMPFVKEGAQVYVNRTYSCPGKYDAGEGYTNETPVIPPHQYAENGICTVCDMANADYLTPVDGVYEIDDMVKLNWFAHFVNDGNVTANAKLTADLDQDESFAYTPIGSTANPYIGTFDGQGHSVTLRINNPDYDYQGLFGVITDGVRIEKVIVKGYVIGKAYVGGIAGGTNGGSSNAKMTDIWYCGNEATITANGVNGAGIIGVNEYGSASIIITNCYNTGNITASNESSAICGWLGGGWSSVRNCYNSGTVKNGENTSKAFGRNSGCYFTNCYYTEGSGTDNSGENKGNGAPAMVTDAALASGELAYSLGDAFYQTLGTDAYPTTDFTKPSVYQLAVTDAGYATFAPTVNVAALPAGVEAFAAQVNKNAKGQVYLAPVDEVPADNAVVVKAAEGSYYYNNAATAAAIEENDLTFSAEAITADGTQYILANGEGGVGFYKATGTIAARKGYLTSTSEVKAFFFESDDATGLNDLKDLKDSNDVIYNLAGQRLQKMQKGINIVGGKKVLK